MPKAEISGSPLARNPGKPRTGRQLRRVIWRWIKRLLIGLLVLGLVALLVVAWLPKPVPVDVAEVTRGPLVVTVDEDGRTRVKDRYVVSAPLSGNVARITLRPGDPVDLGATVARIVPIEAPMLDARSRRTAEAKVAAAAAAARQADAQIARSEAALAFAEKRAAEEATLMQERASTRSELDRAILEQRTARADLESARFGQRVAAHELGMARAALGRLTGETDADEQLQLRSPIEGRVLEVLQQSEGVVQAGAPLVELGDPRALEIVVDVLTRDAVEIRSGAEVSIESWGGAPLQGRVRLVEPSAFTKVSSLGVEEQRVNVVLDLVDAPERHRALGDGYRVEAKVVVWRAKDVLRAPTSAIFRSGAGFAAYTVEGDKARLRPVQIGRRTATHVQILGGLDASSRLVTHPSDKIQDGVSVEPRR